MANIVFIATSVDGYIADKKGGLDWLHAAPVPNDLDTGFNAVMERVDALVMGRNTLDVVLGFGVEWPYSKPVYVLSNTLTKVPEGYEDKVFLVNGELKEIVEQLNQKGLNDLYIDGGATIQGFLQQDLIDEMIITTIPVLLGGGAPLFGDLNTQQAFKLVKSETFAGAINQVHYQRKR